MLALLVLALVGADETRKTLSPADHFEVVLNNRPGFLRCLAEQHRLEPGVTGRVVLRWAVETNGNVSKVEAITPEHASRYFSVCLVDLIHGWKFPPHRVKGEPVEFPIKF